MFVNCASVSPFEWYYEFQETQLVALVWYYYIKNVASK
jgi:hypothetical protein